MGRLMKIETFQRNVSTGPRAWLRRNNFVRRGNPSTLWEHSNPLWPSSCISHFASAHGDGRFTGTGEIGVLRAGSAHLFFRSAVLPG